MLKHGLAGHLVPSGPASTVWIFVRTGKRCGKGAEGTLEDVEETFAIRLAAQKIRTCGVPKPLSTSPGGYRCWKWTLRLQESRRDIGFGGTSSDASGLGWWYEI